MVEKNKEEPLSFVYIDGGTMVLSSLVVTYPSINPARLHEPVTSLTVVKIFDAHDVYE